MSDKPAVDVPKAQAPKGPPADPSPEAIAASYFNQLHGECEAVSKLSLAGANLTLLAQSHQFVSELALWCDTVAGREVELLRVAALEYDFGLLALVQGHYRHSFKSLRLVLELTMQTVYLSSNELHLREWLSNRIDTDWGEIVDKQDGVFSPRFAKGFFAALEIHSQHHAGMAVKLYRECSESVHGNIPKHIPLPPKLGFNQDVFSLWHAKAKILRLIGHFALTLRYFADLSDDDRKHLAPCFVHLAHIPEIKAALEIPKGN